MENNGAPKGQKLRASCDGCYMAKLKCTKERPTCPRCRNLGLVCHYSPSQRMGKPRQNQSQNQQASKATIVRRTSTSSAAAKSPTLAQSNNWPGNSSRVSQPISPSSSHSQTISTASLQSIENGFSLPNSYPSTVATSPTAFNDDFAGWGEGSMFKLEDGFGNFPGATPPLENHILTSGINPTFPLSSEIETCGCFRSIVQALHSMQSASAGPQRSALDIVLNDTKDMVQKGEAMLNCSCAEDSTLIMLLAGLIAKNLSMFQPGNGTCPPSPSLSPPSMSPSDSCYNTLSTSGTIGRHSQSAQTGASRITIGKYTMDGQDEERLRLEIILMELQKLNSLLLKFYGKFANLPHGSDRQTYETLVNFLNQKLIDLTSHLERQKQRMSTVMV